ELTAILKRIRTNLDVEIEQKRDVSLLRERYRNSLPIIREHFLNSLVRGELDEDTVYAKLKEYNISITNAKKWIVAVVDVEGEEKVKEPSLSLHREQELIPISVRQLLEEKLQEYCRCLVFNTTDEMVVLAAIDEENTQTGLIDLLGDICKESKKILEVSITIGVGHSSTDLTQLGPSFRSALNALGYRAVVGEGNVIYIRDVEPVSRGKLQFGGKEESDLISAVKFGKQEEIDRAIAVVMNQLEEARVHYRQRQAYMLGVVNCMIQMVQQYDLDLVEMFGSEVDYYKVVFNSQRREDMTAWLTQTAYRINDALNQARDNTTKNVIREAEQYIQDNYQNPGLSVEMLCRHLHMSPAYFSTMFKKETGQAYIAYLTDLRLNKAVELLNKTDDKTYVIAAKVGYQEQNYFSYVFKKKFGVSPTKYRGANK
ncbi:MAG: helix-turn-helix domain-containing protein, partial [Lachnospiraceae bacterium]